MSAVPVQKIPGERYPFPLRDVPGEVMIEIEAAAKEARTSANAQALGVLTRWAKRRRLDREMPDIPKIPRVERTVRELTAPEFRREPT